jgi:hypothetical protein
MKRTKQRILIHHNGETFWHETTGYMFDNNVLKGQKVFIHRPVYFHHDTDEMTFSDYSWAASTPDGIFTLTPNSWRGCMSNKTAQGMYAICMERFRGLLKTYGNRTLRKMIRDRTAEIKAQIRTTTELGGKTPDSV